MAGRLSFEFHLGRAQPPARHRRGDGGPLRILVIGDFSGRQHSPGPVSPPLAERRPAAVDVDTLETRLRALAPRLAVAGMAADGGTALLAVESLDDFHPDRLVRRLPLLETLRDARERLDDPAAQPGAVETVRRLLAASGDSPSGIAPGPQTATEAESDGDTLSRLLGTSVRRGDAPAHPQTAAAELIRATVAPHVVPPPPAEVAAYRAAADELAGRVLRRILRDPAFRALEAPWRGLAWLVSGVDGDDVQFWMLDATKAELAQDLLGAGGDLSATTLCRLLVERGVPGGEPWAALLGNFCFAPTEADAHLLAALGVLAGACGGPFLAGADPALLGCPDASALADPTRWVPVGGPAAEAWEALRRTAGASWLGLALPRVLLRLPYGPRTDPVDAFAFDEAADPTAPETFLWGNPALAPVLLLARAFAEAGAAVPPGRGLRLDDLPAYSYADAGGQRRLLPCAEALLPERAVDELLARGLIPLVSHRGLPRIEVAQLVSLARPPALLQGPWTAA
jgi:type VI secretion system protein ImpC